MMDFTPRPLEAFSANFEALIDGAMQAKQQAELPRTYLGASRIGDECLRKLAFEFHHEPKDPDREFSGRTLRIFERGHSGEDLMAARLRLAGFELVTHTANNSQIGFAAAKDKDGRARFAGHIDGVITKAPYESGIVCPALWENKVLGNAGFNEVARKGVRAGRPVYFAQMQIYMAYLDLAEHPAVFTAENGNTGEIYAERVPFDREAAQKASDKAVRVVQTQDPLEMPRVAKAPTYFRCKFCDYAARCWADHNKPELPPMGDGGWRFGQ